MDKSGQRISVIWQSSYEAYHDCGLYLGTLGPVLFACLRVAFQAEFSLSLNFLKLMRLILALYTNSHFNLPSAYACTRFSISAV